MWPENNPLSPVSTSTPSPRFLRAPLPVWIAAAMTVVPRPSIVRFRPRPPIVDPLIVSAPSFIHAWFPASTMSTPSSADDALPTVTPRPPLARRVSTCGSERTWLPVKRRLFTVKSAPIAVALDPEMTTSTPPPGVP